MTANTALLLDRAASHTVRKVAPADVPALSQAMARAFYEDPVVGHWCLADETRRMRRLEGIFELFTRRLYLGHGESYTADALAGAAFWLPPDTWKLGPVAQSALVARMAPITGRATARILQVMSLIEAKHPHDPHYYLQFLGVEPERQGLGLGSDLMAPVLDRCDREGVPAYLEASSERNCALYRRHGFAVVEELRLPGGGPSLWRMWREPRPS